MSEYPEHPLNKCPECGQLCIDSFRCTYATRFCNNGHVWHIIKDTVVSGYPGGMEDNLKPKIEHYLASIKTS